MTFESQETGGLNDKEDLGDLLRRKIEEQGVDSGGTSLETETFSSESLENSAVIELMDSARFHMGASYSKPPNWSSFVAGNCKFFDIDDDPVEYLKGLEKTAAQLSTRINDILEESDRVIIEKPELHNELNELYKRLNDLHTKGSKETREIWQENRSTFDEEDIS